MLKLELIISWFILMLGEKMMGYTPSRQKECGTNCFERSCDVPVGQKSSEEYEKEGDRSKQVGRFESVNIRERHGAWRLQRVQGAIRA